MVATNIGWLDVNYFLLDTKRKYIHFHQKAGRFITLSRFYSYSNKQHNNNDDRIYKIVDFAVPADHRIKLKECEKKDKYFDLARELKKLRNICTIFTINAMCEMDI